MDDYGTHTHPKRKSGLAQHPRFHLHFTPTSSSRLKRVQRSFRCVFNAANSLSVSSRNHVAELRSAIQEFIAVTNYAPNPSSGPPPAIDKILAEVRHRTAILDTHRIVGLVVALNSEN